MYYGDSFADLATMRLEGKIKGIYAQAYREIEEKLNTFLAQSVIKEKEYEAKVQAGKLSQEWFDRWKSGQVFIGKRWRDLRQNISEEIYNSRKSATDMINDERKAVFQDNVNYAQYTIDKDHSFGISFTIYDNATVTRLIKEDPDLVPDVKYPDPQIDYAWSKKQITSAITQGILQGESIPELAKRVGKKLQSSNTASMVRCARTAMTGAQNSGRIQAMHNAQDMGIQVQKVWIATLDDRTRDSHRDLDGQTIGVDEPFHSLYGEIMYPADPNAAPADTWNCFVGNTKVASDSEIIRSYKHDYSGELITVKTASGVKFTCTPNHPILTDRGWVGAKFLNNGDRLAETRCIKSDFLGVDPDIDHTLSCFDTIHKFFEEVGIKRTCSLGVNFHGDIPTTDVEIVSKERLLWNYRNSCEFQGKNKLSFKFTTPFVFSKGHFMSGFRRVHVSFLSLVSRMRQTLSFFLTRISHSGIHGLRTVSNMDSRIFESKRNSVSGNVQFLGESLAGLSSRVFFDNIVDIKTSSVSHVPVYNLQTQNGYYFVSSDSSIKSDSEKINGIFVIAHNCRCSLGYNYPKYSNQYDTRAAREVDWEEGGQTEQIPYMTYKEWTKWRQTGQLPQRGLAVVATQNDVDEQARIKREKDISHIKTVLDSIPEQYHDIIFASIDNADDTMLDIISRTVDGVKFAWYDEYNDKPSHYDFSGNITIIMKDSFGEFRSKEDILRTFWHEYGHYVDDSRTSNSGYGLDRGDYYLNGIGAVVNDNHNWNNATVKDVNELLRKIGLDSTYECKYEDGMYSAYIYNKNTGEFVDPRDSSSYLETQKLMNVLHKWANEFSGKIELTDYMIKNYDFPVQPEREKYLESYFTPKRNLYREREVFKGAREAYQTVMEQYYKAVDAFNKSHNIDEIREKWNVAYEKAKKREDAVAAATDTLDGGVMGSFMAFIKLGGHTPDYYALNQRGLDEGIANVFSNLVTKSEDEREAFESLCPNLYGLIKGAIKND